MILIKHIGRIWRICMRQNICTWYAITLVFVVYEQLSSEISKQKDIFYLNVTYFVYVISQAASLTFDKYFERAPKIRSPNHSCNIRRYTVFPKVNGFPSLNITKVRVSYFYEFFYQKRYFKYHRNISLVKSNVCRDIFTIWSCLIKIALLW